MADSLDDFFAKKDKKRKNKNQSSAFSAEALVRALEEGSKQNDFSSRREGKSSAAMELLGLDANDNDWKDFEEVERRDYTGLKVKEMSIQDQDEEQRRLHEQADQVPETIPWKSKEETVAAIISAKEDLNPYNSELMRESNEETKMDNGAANEADVNAEKQSSETQDNTESDTNKAVSSSTTQETDQVDANDTKKAEEKTPAPELLSTNNPAGTGLETAKKEGDSKPSAKYVPPHERLASDVKVLEPIRLGKSTSSRLNARGGRNTIDITDENLFPSLG